MIIYLSGLSCFAQMTKESQQLYQQASQLEYQKNIEGAIELIKKAIKEKRFDREGT